ASPAPVQSRRPAAVAPHCHPPRAAPARRAAAALRPRLPLLVASAVPLAPHELGHAGLAVVLHAPDEAAHLVDQALAAVADDVGGRSGRHGVRIPWCHVFEAKDFLGPPVTDLVDEPPGPRALVDAAAARRG